MCRNAVIFHTVAQTLSEIFTQLISLDINAIGTFYGSFSGEARCSGDSLISIYYTDIEIFDFH